MRRADRLFQLVQLLRSRDVVTAREIAGETRTQWLRHDERHFLQQAARALR